MASDLAADFGAAVRAHEASFTRTDPAGFRDAVADLLEQPAVGVPLPYDDVSLDGLDVRTDLTTAAVRGAATGVCAAGFGIASYGTVVIRPSERGEEPVSLYPGRHVAVVRARDLVPDIRAAFDRLDDDVGAGGGDAILATGPSATADMGELVRDVHGPRAVDVVLVEGGEAA